MAIRDLSGIGALQDALRETNENLAAVLRELQETNGQRLELVARELQRLNANVERLARPVPEQR